MCIWTFLWCAPPLVRPGSPQQVVSEPDLHKSHWARQASGSHGGSSQVGQMIQRTMIDQARTADGLAGENARRFGLRGSNPM